MRIVKDSRFWVGVAVGTFVAPMILAKVAPNLKAKIPSGS